MVHNSLCFTASMKSISPPSHGSSHGCSIQHRQRHPSSLVPHHPPMCFIIYHVPGTGTAPAGWEGGSSLVLQQLGRCSVWSPALSCFKLPVGIHYRGRYLALLCLVLTYVGKWRHASKPITHLYGQPHRQWCKIAIYHSHCYQEWVM